jgi:ABC-type glycerol-3-phosphate transport system substrate-binding protein
MTTSRRAFVAAIAAVATAPPAAAQQRATVPITDFINQTWTPGARPGSFDAVRQAIIQAATGLKWETEPGDNGSLRAQLLVRGKHTIRVSIVWTASVFSVRYAGSENMSYWEPSAGRRYIHPNYNVWTEQLVKAIRNELERV